MSGAQWRKPDIALLLAALTGDPAARRAILEDARRQAIAHAIEAQRTTRMAAPPKATLLMKRGGIDPRRDLDGADLRGVVFRGEDLARYDFGGACLAGCDMREVNLEYADLSHADLTGADLTGAYLGRASFAGAEMTKATIKHAILAGAVLTGASLPQADVTGADFKGAIVTDAYFDKDAEQKALNLVVPPMSGSARDRRRGKWQEALWQLAALTRPDLKGLETKDLVATDRLLASDRSSDRRLGRGGGPSAARRCFSLALIRWRRGQLLEANHLMEEAFRGETEPELKAEVLLAWGVLGSVMGDQQGLRRIGTAAVAFNDLGRPLDVNRSDEATKLALRLQGLDRDLAAAEAV